jgi:hypothetical protein
VSARARGFYWVRIGEAYTFPDPPQWAVAEWDGSDWLLPGHDCPESGANVDEVGARIVPPETALPPQTWKPEAYAALADALAILSRAKTRAVFLVLEAVREERGNAYRALETWRWVANAYDHLNREQRAVLGLGRRGDPCLPDWPAVPTKEDVR